MERIKKLIKFLLLIFITLMTIQIGYFESKKHSLSATTNFNNEFWPSFRILDFSKNPQGTSQDTGDDGQILAKNFKRTKRYNPKKSNNLSLVANKPKNTVASSNSGIFHYSKYLDKHFIVYPKMPTTEIECLGLVGHMENILGAENFSQRPEQTVALVNREEMTEIEKKITKAIDDLKIQTGQVVAKEFVIFKSDNVIQISRHLKDGGNPTDYEYEVRRAKPKVMIEMKANFLSNFQSPHTFGLHSTTTMDPANLQIILPTNKRIISPASEKKLYDNMQGKEEPKKAQQEGKKLLKTGKKKLAPQLKGLEAKVLKQKERFEKAQQATIKFTYVSCEFKDGRRKQRAAPSASSGSSSSSSFCSPMGGHVDGEKIKKSRRTIIVASREKLKNKITARWRLTRFIQENFYTKNPKSQQLKTELMGTGGGAPILNKVLSGGGILKNIKMGLHTLKQRLVKFGPSTKWQNGGGGPQVGAKLKKYANRLDKSGYLFALRDFTSASLAGDWKTMALIGGMTGVQIGWEMAGKFSVMTSSRTFMAVSRVAGVGLTGFGVGFQISSLYGSAQCLKEEKVNTALCATQRDQWDSGRGQCQDEGAICGGRDAIFDLTSSSLFLTGSVLGFAFPPTAPLIILFGLVSTIGGEFYQAHSKVAKFGRYIPLTQSEHWSQIGRSVIGLDISPYLKELREKQKLNSQVLDVMTNFIEGQEEPKNGTIFWWAYLGPAYDMTKIGGTGGQPIADNFVDIRSSAWVKDRGFERWAPNPFEFTGGKRQFNFTHENFFCRPTTDTVGSMDEFDLYDLDDESLCLHSGKAGVVKRHASFPEIGEIARAFDLTTKSPKSSFRVDRHGPSYLCKDALGVRSSRSTSSNFKGQRSTLIRLGDGTDFAFGSDQSQNYFVVGQGAKFYHGGPHPDTFLVNASLVTGAFFGGYGGPDTVQISEFVKPKIFIRPPTTENGVEMSEVDNIFANVTIEFGPDDQHQHQILTMAPPTTKGANPSTSTWIGLSSIENFVGRRNGVEVIRTVCANKFIDTMGTGGDAHHRGDMDMIQIPFSPSKNQYNLTMVLHPWTKVENREGAPGQFIYQIYRDHPRPNKGSPIIVDIVQKNWTSLTGTGHHIQIFYPPSELTVELTQDMVQTGDEDGAKINLTHKFTANISVTSALNLVVNFDFDDGQNYDENFLQLTTLDEARIMIVPLKENKNGAKKFEPIFYHLLTHPDDRDDPKRPTRIGAQMNRNIFFVNGTYSKISGGWSDDHFLIGEGANVQILDGGPGGLNTLQVDQKLNDPPAIIKLYRNPRFLEVGGKKIKLAGNFSHIVGRAGVPERLHADVCTTTTIDLRGGNRQFFDKIYLLGDKMDCGLAAAGGFKIQLKIYPTTQVFVRPKKIIGGIIEYLVLREDYIRVGGGGRRKIDFRRHNSKMKLSANNSATSLHKIYLEFDASELIPSLRKRGAHTFTSDIEPNLLDLVVTFDPEVNKETNQTVQIWTRDQVQIEFPPFSSQASSRAPYFKFVLTQNEPTKDILGVQKYQNYFFINGSYSLVRGGNLNDHFIIGPEAIVTTLDAGLGGSQNILEIHHDNQEKVCHIDFAMGQLTLMHDNLGNSTTDAGAATKIFELKGQFSDVIGRLGDPDIFIGSSSSCTTKSIDLQKGSSGVPDVILISVNQINCQSETHIRHYGSSHMILLNGANEGRFVYTIDDDMEGQFYKIFYASPWQPTSNSNISTDDPTMESQEEYNVTHEFRLPINFFDIENLECDPKAGILKISRLSLENESEASSASFQMIRLGFENFEKHFSTSNASKFRHALESDPPTLLGQLIFPTFLTLDGYQLNVNHLCKIHVMGSEKITKSNFDDDPEIQNDGYHDDSNFYLEIIDKHTTLVNNLGLTLILTLTSSSSENGTLEQIIFMGGDDQTDHFVNHPSLDSHLVGSAGGDENIFTIFPTLNTETRVFIHFREFDANSVSPQQIQKMIEEEESIFENLTAQNPIFDLLTTQRTYVIDLKNFINFVAMEPKFFLPTVLQQDQNLHVVIQYEKQKFANDGDDDQQKIFEQKIILVNGVEEYEKVVIFFYAGLYKIHKIPETKNPFFDYEDEEEKNFIWEIRLEDLDLGSKFSHQNQKSNWLDQAFHNLPIMDDLPIENETRDDSHSSHDIDWNILEKSSKKLMDDNSEEEILILSQKDLIEYIKTSTPLILPFEESMDAEKLSIHQNVFRHQGNLIITNTVPEIGFNLNLAWNPATTTSTLDDDGGGRKFSIFLLDVQKSMAENNVQITLNFFHHPTSISDPKVEPQIITNVTFTQMIRDWDTVMKENEDILWKFWLLAWLAISFSGTILTLTILLLGRHLLLVWTGRVKVYHLVRRQKGKSEREEGLQEGRFHEIEE